MKTRGFFIVAIAVLMVLMKSAAATYSFEPTADARIIAFPGYLGLNFGPDILSVYTDSSAFNTQRTFIQFNVSSVTLGPNERVQSATLTLIADTSFGKSGSQPMEIYRVLLPWTESGLTWSNRDATHPWGTNGGDFVGIGGQPYAVSTASPTNGQAVAWDVTALVQEWVTHATTNNGLLLKSSSGNYLTFGQRELATASLRPNLKVIVGAALAPFQIKRNGAQIVMSWTNANNVLQEKTNLNPAVPWQDSGRAVVLSNGTNSVTISAPTGNNFFRLRLGP